MTFTYRLAQFLTYVILYPLYRPKAHHNERMPATGRCVLVCNHQAWFDPFLLIICTARRLRVMAKIEVFRVPILRTLAKWFGAFPVDRAANDVHAVKQSLSILKNEEVLCLFPEGTRGDRDEMMPLHAGAAMFAIKTDAPLVPVHMSRIRIFRRVHVRFGEPISFTSYNRRTDAQTLKEATERIRSAIVHASHEGRNEGDRVE